MKAGRRLDPFSNQCLLDGSRPDARHCLKKTPLPTSEDASAQHRSVRSIFPQDRTTNDMTRITWPTNIQSRTPDGQFGPAKQIKDWGDCWFMASLGAIANNEQGRQILAESIMKISVDGIRGYAVTFKGAPYHPIFLSEQTLDHFLDINGGDADTRLIELAADRFFSVQGHFVYLFINALMNSGMDQNQAEQCFDQMCQVEGVRDPNHYNPMREGTHNFMAFFIITGIFPDVLWVPSASTLQTIDIKAYLNRYATNSQDGPLISLGSLEHPLGDTVDDNKLVVGWDAIRTEITANGTMDPQEQAFLNALDRWLETPDHTTGRALNSAAENLTLQHLSPLRFVALLANSHIALRPNHRAVLRSGVQEVLGAGPGYIGVPGHHSETIEGINEAQNTFTYCDSNYPTLVHTGELSSLIRAIANGRVRLYALEPTTGQDAAESSHAGEKRGRHLLAFHHQAVNDGKIDPAEIGPLANLMAMDAGTFRHVYDSDRNGVIEGSELNAVQLRVDRWVTHLTLTPIW